MTKYRGHMRPSEETAAKARTMLFRVGEATFARMAGLDRHTVTRAGARLAVHGASLYMIEQALEMTEDEIRDFERAYNEAS